MPFTPFHFGPAAAIKAIAGGYFSFMTFGFSQVLIDLESLYYLVQGESYVHRFLHTYIGATLVVVFSVIVGKPICEITLKLWNLTLSPKEKHLLHIKPKIPLIAAISGCAFGAYSHVFLDSIMHSDIRPLSPFNTNNELLQIISLGELHLYCAISGVFGVMVLSVIYFWNKWTYEI